ncbi:hypothetical protein O0L34_g8195 [Tuta absoluta]|nr:hypothetical protein O0L34_g8195 [Tuta absoluta]
MNPYDTVSSISEHSVHSDCDCYVCQYEREQRELDNFPFCKSARNPVLYYAQTHHRKKKDCNSCTKPNFFVRAFRWYTKEHNVRKDNVKPIEVPCQEECNDDEAHSDAPNIGAFATWLDTKYNQYLTENGGRDLDACRVLYTQTSVIENCDPGTEDQGQSGTCGRKRFSKFKSQWKTKVQKSHGKEKETCERECVRHQPDTPSTEFIMAPKNMSRAASVCCYPTPANSVVKNVAKSRSATVTVCTHRSGYDSAEFSKPPVEQMYGTCQKCKNKSASKQTEASCQHTAPTGQNAQTQYEPNQIPSKQRLTSPSATNAKKANITHHRHVICQCPSPDKWQVTALQHQNQPTQKPICPKGPIPYRDLQQPYSNIQQQSPSTTQQLLVQYKETVIDTCPNLQQPSPSKTQPEDQKPCLNLQQPCSEFKQPCPYLQRLSPNVPKLSPNTMQQKQIQYQDTYPEVSKPCPGYQQELPSLTQQVQVQTQRINSGILTPSPCLLQPCPSQTLKLQNQYQETNSGVPRPCPTFQEPCPTLDELVLAETCPSVKEPCAGRRPCPSLRKVCPPCPGYKHNVSKTSVQQTPTTVTLRTNSQLQYQQQPYQPSIQMQSWRIDSQRLYPDNKPTHGAVCLARPTKNDCCVRKQMPSFVEPLSEPNSRVGETPLKQDEYSPTIYAAKANFVPTAGPSTRETSTETNTNSVQAQGTTLLFAQHQNSAYCYCSNCCPSGMTYNRTGYNRINESVQQPTSNQNAFTTTSTEERKCSMKCPYYSTISIKGQNTQTSQNVQFAQASDQSVQTTGKAIPLDRNTFEYPLYLRVVRADKLQ